MLACGPCAGYPMQLQLILSDGNSYRRHDDHDYEPKLRSVPRAAARAHTQGLTKVVCEIFALKNEV